MSTFEYSPSKYVPFRDKEAIERCRRIKREDITKHPNPDFKISVIKDADVGPMWITEIFYWFKKSSDENKPVVLIMPNPIPAYRCVAYMINKLRVNCQKVHLFAMDEYANEYGVIAPEDWPYGFMHALKKYLYFQIDPELRMPESQVHGMNNQNINSYGKMIADMGGADACFSGPGWTGHCAFIEPDAPEFDYPLEEWKKLGPRICTLSPFTLAQNSLHGSFGKSGDIAAVPPKAATIGPAEVIGSKYRLDVNSISVHGTTTSWQRLMTRLCAHGPVTPKLPTSIHQILKSNFWISETAAQDIEADWDKEY